jgi:hypothetical protein
MEYDGMNKDEANPNGKHQWCLKMQSISTQKREDNILKSGATLPLRHMIVYEWCTKASVVLNPLCIK